MEYYGSITEVVEFLGNFWGRWGFGGLSLRAQRGNLVPGGGLRRRDCHGLRPRNDKGGGVLESGWGELDYRGGMPNGDG